MKRIVVLGSKPGAQLPDADAAYCANGAIGFYAQELLGIKTIVNVVSARILNKSRMLDEKSESEFYSEKFSAICNAKPSELIMIGSIAKPYLATELGHWLEGRGYKSPITYLDPAAKVNLQKKLTGLPFPLPLKAAFRGSFRMAINDLIDLAMFRIGLGKGEVNRAFRPSTGAITLLCAIEKYGSDAEYVIAGIGLSERNKHQVNGKSTYIPAKFDRAGMEPHVLADEYIFSALASRFRLQSDEPAMAALIRKATGNITH